MWYISGVYKIRQNFQLDFDRPELWLPHGKLVLHGREDENHLGDDDRPEEGDVHCTHPDKHFWWGVEGDRCRMQP